MTSVVSCANGLGYSVTAFCHAAGPSKTARLCQRWATVQTASGRSETSEARRAPRNAEADERGVAAWAMGGGIEQRPGERNEKERATQA